MSDQLVALRLFVRIARTRSFSRAAKEERISQPTASRMMTALEEQLGVTLLARSTRAVTLTDAGQVYLERVGEILEALDEANQAVRSSGELRGTLRVGASAIFASRVIVRSLPSFMRAHPSLRIDIAVDDRRQRLLEEGIDMVVRFGALTDSSAVSRRIASWPIVLAAAPSYLNEHGAPRKPEDLAAHRVIMAGPLAKDGKWGFRSGPRRVAVEIDGSLTIGASDVALSAALAGLGVIAATGLALAPAIASGDLTRLLPRWSLGDVAAHALFPGRSPKPAARAFTDHLVREIAAHHTWATPPSTKSSVPVT